jgi:uncharacterized protein (DUF305 family)
VSRLFPSPALAAIVVIAAAACASVAPATAVTPAAGKAGERASDHLVAGVEFVRGMIAHHAQALDMAALAQGRTADNRIRALATKISLSQTDEIAQMERWVEERQQAASTLVRAEPSRTGTGAHDHAHATHRNLAGMASTAEMQRLAAARGPEFDTLFLELMIRHHEGALVMVDELFATSAATADSELYRIAADIDSEQRIEIGRMRSVLNTLRQR